MNGEHPCNICESMICKREETYVDCVWQHIYSASYSCEKYDCMMNYEGCCLGCFYNKCGCKK